MTPPATREDSSSPAHVLCADRGRATRWRLAVLGADEPDVVCAAGGLLYDRSMTGWDVTVYLAELTDDRPFRILGVRTELFDDASSLSHESHSPEAIMASARLYDENDAVRGQFRQESRSDCTEMAIWGGDWPTALGPGVRRVEHRLSAAARAFKMQAMIAAGLTPATVDPIEVFRGSSAFGTHGYVGPARHVRHLDPAQTVPVDVVLRNEV